MRIKLVCPRMTARPMDSALKTHMAPPLALLVLAALAPPEHQVELADENVERARFDDRPDLVGITVKVDTADRAFAIADAYRRRGVAVVLGGVHASCCPESCAAHADAIVLGEAEGLWERLLADLAARRLQPVYAHDVPPDLADAPIPRWELLAGRNYLYTNTLTVSRGCPWQCDFCYNSAPGVASVFRTKPIGAILREIDSLRTRHVMFIDDNLIGDRRFAAELFGAIRPLGLSWHAAVSADVGRDEALLDLMADSGGQSLFIGFETINDANLAAAAKRQNRVADYDRTIERIHERGMMVNASIVLGFDRDGPEVFDRTRDWLVSRRVETMTAHILTPYPNTRLHARLAAEGRITDTDLRHYTTARVVFRPAGMSAAALQRGYLRLYDEFYSWRSILRRTPIHPRQRKAYFLFNLLYRKYGRVLAALGRAGLMGTIGRIARRLSYRGVR
ncbi:MAG: radical SAM protein [Planctomycetes bacterium]|nr:radical SAM protein [Planctomycetota bacterium]